MNFKKIADTSFKEREKNPSRSDIFGKVAGFSNTFPRVLLMDPFRTCKNGTKPRKAPHINGVIYKLGMKDEIFGQSTSISFCSNICYSNSIIGIYKSF